LRGWLSPLTDLTSKRTPNVLQWGDEQEKAFQSLKAKLCDSHMFGSCIMVFCDHNPLQYITESATKSAKLLRWSLALAKFDLDITYTKGSENVEADYLSRM